jgi:hypothetical protein
MIDEDEISIWDREIFVNLKNNYSWITVLMVSFGIHVLILLLLSQSFSHRKKIENHRIEVKSVIPKPQWVVLAAPATLISGTIKNSKNNLDIDITSIKSPFTQTKKEDTVEKINVESVIPKTSKILENTDPLVENKFKQKTPLPRPLVPESSKPLIPESSKILDPILNSQKIMPSIPIKSPVIAPQGVLPDSKVILDKKNINKQLIAPSKTQKQQPSSLLVQSKKNNFSDEKIASTKKPEKKRAFTKDSNPRKAFSSLDLQNLQKTAESEGQDGQDSSGTHHHSGDKFKWAEKIQSCWKVPWEVRGDTSLKIIVSITINKLGKITDVKCVKDRSTHKHPYFNKVCESILTLFKDHDALDIPKEFRGKEGELEFHT